MVRVYSKKFSINKKEEILQTQKKKKEKEKEREILISIKKTVQF